MRSPTRSVATAWRFGGLRIGPFSIDDASETTVLPPLAAVPFLPRRDLDAEERRLIVTGREIHGQGEGPVALTLGPELVAIGRSNGSVDPPGDGPRMNVARTPDELEPAERAVAIGTFDGVHRGHRAVIDAVVATGLRPTVVTFDPHPRAVLGYEVELLSTFERRLELLEAAGVADVLVVEFTTELSLLEPEEFVAQVLEPIGTRTVLAGEGFRFGHKRRGDLELLRALGIDARAVPLLEGVSSSRIREHLKHGEIREAAVLLGRAPELEGPVVFGDQRGGTLGFPTANLSVDRGILVPKYGIYAGQALGHRAAVSIGVNPHYGGVERRIEAFLLDFSGDLYGTRLRLELWERLRDERAFESEADLVEQIARDTDQARSALPPV